MKSLYELAQGSELCPGREVLVKLDSDSSYAGRIAYQLGLFIILETAHTFSELHSQWRNFNDRRMIIGKDHAIRINRPTIDFRGDSTREVISFLTGNFTPDNILKGHEDTSHISTEVCAKLEEDWSEEEIQTTPADGKQKGNKSPQSGDQPSDTPSFPPTMMSYDTAGGVETPNEGHNASLPQYNSGNEQGPSKPRDNKVPVKATPSKSAPEKAADDGSQEEIAMTRESNTETLKAKLERRKKVECTTKNPKPLDPCVSTPSEYFDIPSSDKFEISSDSDDDILPARFPSDAESCIRDSPTYRKKTQNWSLQKRHLLINRDYDLDIGFLDIEYHELGNPVEPEGHFDV